MTSRDRTILTDCDGVMLAWEAAFHEFMKSRGFAVIDDNHNEFSIAKTFGITEEEAMPLIYEFNHSNRIGKLQPFADSVEYVSKLAEKGFDFIVVTSVSDDPAVVQFRKDNLNAIFGPVFDNIHCLKLNELKRDMLSNWRDTGYFWVEDHPMQAEAGINNGLNTILIEHPYNISFTHDSLHRVSHHTPWQEIYQLVLDDYQIHQ